MLGCIIYTSNNITVLNKLLFKWLVYILIYIDIPRYNTYKRVENHSAPEYKIKNIWLKYNNQKITKIL